ncbi:MAG: chromate transporter [Cyanobacteria bacterium]|nr:chromate transporter [Cyanobacteriota bacterium]
MNIAVLYLLLLRATAMSFSGFASVPMVREDLVLHRGVLTDQQLNNAVAISQASPGPLGIYIVIVGYFAGGVPGAVAGILVVASPAIMALPIAYAVRRRRTAAIRGACSGIVIGSCVLMITTAVQLAPEAAPSSALMVLAALAFGALATTRVPPVVAVVLCAVLGLIVS